MEGTLQEKEHPTGRTCSVSSMNITEFPYSSKEEYNDGLDSDDDNPDLWFETNGKRLCVTHSYTN